MKYIFSDSPDMCYPAIPVFDFDEPPILKEEDLANFLDTCFKTNCSIKSRE